jgi:hypothetical protein
LRKLHDWLRILRYNVFYQKIKIYRNIEILVFLKGLAGGIIFISCLLPLFYFPILYLSHPFIYLLTTFSFSCIYVYFVFYTFYAISLSFRSFLCFSLNYLFLYFYLGSILNLVYGLKQPLYLEDISPLTQYRYFAFVIVGFIAISLYGWVTLAPGIASRLKPFFSLISYPYLYEEIVRVLVTWEFPF